MLSKSEQKKLSKSELVKLRSRFFREITSFFENRDFLQVRTPVLVPNPGLEPHLELFKTEFVPSLGGGQRKDFYLPTSPELHLKKALAFGLPKIFEIASAFRNGEAARHHAPEFLMLEWYRSPGLLDQIAKDTEELCSLLHGQFGASGAPPLMFSHKDLPEYFERITRCSLIDGLNAWDAGRTNWLAETAKSQGHRDFTGTESFEEAFDRLMIDCVEPSLKNEVPTFLWNYPVTHAALSRRKPDNALLCSRFEFYFAGLEIANAFQELTDPVEQRKRCLEDQQRRIELYGSTPPLDEEFLESLSELPVDVSGIALGVERLLQVLTKAPDLRSVLAFPPAL